MPEPIDLDDRDARDEAERRESRVLLDALTQRRTLLGGESTVPDDRKLSETILAAAQKRSAQIRASQISTTRLETSNAAIPWWLKLAWVAAIVGVVAAFWYLRQP